MALPSIGTTAMRWFCRVARTIVVAPASGSTEVSPARARDQIGADLLELQRSVVGHGLLEVDHGVERVVVDLDQLGGIDGGRFGLGDDHGDRLTDESNLVDRQRRPGAGSVEDHETVERLHAQVGRRVDGQHPWRRPGRSWCRSR